MSASIVQPEITCPLHREPRALLGLGRILVVVDPAATQHPCVEKAARIATHTGAELELYVCDAEPDSGDDEAGRDARHESLITLLDGLARPLRARGLRVRTRSEWAVPLEKGVGYHVIRSRPDLVVKDTHRHDDPCPALTFTDWTLMRQIQAPLLLVRPDLWPSRLRMIISVDPCHPAERTPALDEAMLELGGLLGDALRADLNVFHVLECPPHLPGEPVAPAARRTHHAVAKTLVRQLVANMKEHGSPISAHFDEGRVAERIVAFAEAKRPQILVMGASPRHRWSFSAAEEETAARILNAVPCDMLIVKPPGFTSPLQVTEE